MSIAFLTAAARAHAMIALSDGRVAWPEEHLFASRLREDPAFRMYSAEELNAASTAAFSDVKDSAETIEAMADSIAALLTTRDERESVMRAARIALIADGIVRDQEDSTIQVLAVTLGLDASKA